MKFFDGITFTEADHVCRAEMGELWVKWFAYGSNGYRFVWRFKQGDQWRRRQRTEDLVNGQSAKEYAVLLLRQRGRVER